METSILLNTLTIISSIIFLIAVYYSFKLSKETKYEKYWLSLALGFFIFAIHHWMMIPWNLDLINNQNKELIETISSIIGSVFMGYGVFGLYSFMKKVRNKLE